MRYTLRPARPADARAVVALLNQLAQWLHARGYDQWSDARPDSDERVESAVRGGEFWLLEVDDDPEPIGTIRLTSHGDTDFWSPTELTTPAIYLSKLAIRRDYAGQELGDLLLTWTRDYGARHGAAVVRFDAWKTNSDLQRYYTSRGWRHVRTVNHPNRRSGALFELPTQLHLEVRTQLHERPSVEVD